MHPLIKIPGFPKRFSISSSNSQISIIFLCCYNIQRQYFKQLENDKRIHDEAKKCDRTIEIRLRLFNRCFLFPHEWKRPILQTVNLQVRSSSFQIEAYCKTLYLKFLNELYLNDNNNKLYLQDSHRVLQYCKSYFVLITNS